MSSTTEANRANAQHSTGPKTDAGKSRSSLNALSHGLTSQLVVMPNEDLAVYQAHLKSITDECRPKGALETQLVQAIADASWRLNRVAAIEANLLAVAPEEGQNAMAMLMFLERQSKVIANLSLHTQRLSRQIKESTAELRALQKPRLDKEEHDLDNLLLIMEMYESRKETYEPSESGFVFTQTQIDVAIQARDRERLVNEALDDDDDAEAA
jgi:hypothetical protein